MKKFNLLKFVWNGLNRLDAKFFERHHPEYQSKFAKQVLIVTGLFYLANMLWRFSLEIPQFAQIEVEYPLFWVWMSYGVLVIYWSICLKHRWNLLVGGWRKFGYTLFSLILLVVVGPYLFPTLVTLIVLAIALQIALWLLAVVVWVVALFDGGSGSGKKRWRLDNGDEVEERSGLFGDKSYSGTSGKSYITDDGGRTFTEN